MSKTDYIENSLHILNDKNYIPESQHINYTTEKKLISDLKKSKMISGEILKNYMIYSAISPKYYELPKIHETLIKLRPTFLGLMRQIVKFQN